MTIYNKQVANDDNDEQEFQRERQADTKKTSNRSFEVIELYEE
jgi:hypothetical protein